jgi:hypothetical protein
VGDEGATTGGVQSQNSQEEQSDNVYQSQENYPHLAVTTTGDVRGKMKERMLFSVEGCASTEKFIVCLRDRSSVRSLFFFKSPSG